MSHSLDSQADGNGEGNLPHQRLSQMVKQGRAWSGHERNCSYLNTGGQRFANISAVSGFDYPDDARALAPVDWDQDGDMDFWVSNRNAPRLRLMRNESLDTNSHLALRLAGREANRDAIGARVELRATVAGKPSRLIRTLRAGEGFLSQSSKWLHFGLSDATAIESVTVQWPGGAAESFSGVEINGRHRLVQGEGTAQKTARPPGALSVNPVQQIVPDQPATARIPLVTLLPVPALAYQTFDGTPVTLPIGQGKPVLINLWASWCQPCQVELDAFTQDWTRLKEAGIEVIALSVDGLGDDSSTPAKAAALVKKAGFPFQTGRATAPLLSVLQHLHDSLTPMERALPVPSSFLVDGSGRLAVIYKGRVEVETLLSDRGHSARSRKDRFVHSTPLKGRVIDHSLVAGAADSAETRVRFQFARDVQQAGLLEDAGLHYREVLALKPDFLEAHNNLALVYSEQKRWSEAIRHLEEAMKIRPDVPEAAYNLGNVYEKKGDLESAASHYRRAVELRPDYPRAYNSLGLILARLGKLDEAARAFQDEIRVNPQFADGYNNLGLTLMSGGQPVQALGFFEKAIELNPSYADAYNNLGITFRRLGQNDRARLQYEQAIRLQPNFAEARNNLGLLLMGEGQLPLARQQFIEALKAQPDFAPAQQNLDKAVSLMGGR